MRFGSLGVFPSPLLSGCGRKSPPRERVLDAFAYVFYNVMLIAYEIFLFYSTLVAGAWESRKIARASRKGSNDLRIRPPETFRGKSDTA